VVGFVVCVCVAEARLAWRSWFERDWRYSVQNMLLSTPEPIAGKTVYTQRRNRADRFVLAAMRGAKIPPYRGWSQAVADSQPRDYLLAAVSANESANLRLVGRDRELTLYQRTPGR